MWGSFPALCVETGRWASERSSSPAQSAGGAGTCIASATSARPSARSCGSCLGLLVYSEDIAVVTFAALWVSEDGVGFRDLGEAGGSLGVGFVYIRVG
jgi:hypothetical protein